MASVMMLILIIAAAGYAYSSTGCDAETLIPQNINQTPAERTPQNQVPTANGNGMESAMVSRVIDGDTIELDTGERVRFIGIDTPEIGEPLADEATLFVENLILGQRVWLEPEGRNEDRFGRLRRYIWLTEPEDPNDIAEIMGQQLNAMLLMQGYATVLVVNAGEVRHEALFRDLEQS